MTDNLQIQRLRDIMVRLRDPENGCPWDIEQTFDSIVPCTIEEAYEVADAIADKDMPKLKDELGDLLLNVVFHAQMASEAGYFTLDDVAEVICEKMERRHPHIFGDVQAEDSAAVLKNWEDIKERERQDNKDASALADVPSALPALSRAYKLSKRAVRVGFEWNNIHDLAHKVEEELNEFQVEVDADNHAAMEEEMGDLLFTVVNLARWHKVNPETALRNANTKFEKRFRHMEGMALSENREFSSLDADEREALWERAKKSEKQRKAS